MTWQVEPFRRLFRESKEVNGSSPIGQMLSISGYRGVETKFYESASQMRDDEQLETYRVVRPGQLAVNTMWLNYAGLGVSDLLGHVSPAYRTYWISERLDSRYVHHLMRSSIYVQGYTALLTGIRPNSLQMSSADLMAFPVLVPPFDKQRVIANYLDRETARIDAFIAKNEQLIALLAERRASEIAQLVLGVPEADVTLSGRENAARSQEWSIGPLKRFLRSLDARRIPLSSEERGQRAGEYDYYGASGVIDHIDDYLFDEPLVLVSEDGANLLMRSTPIAFAARGRYWVNNHAHVLRPLDGDVDFWADRIEALDLAPVVTGAAQPKLTAEALMNLTVSAPEPDEQRVIAGAIREIKAKADHKIAIARRGVQLARERRAALISAAVTGQIDVRVAG